MPKPTFQHMTHNTVNVPGTVGTGDMKNPGANAHNAATLAAAFPQSWILDTEAKHPGDATLTGDAAGVKAHFNSTVMNYGVLSAGATYYGLGATYTSAYDGAPSIDKATGILKDYDNVVVSGLAGGGPGTAFTPNTASPTEGVTPTNKPIAPALAVASPGGGAYVGEALGNPATTSATAGSMTLSDFITPGEFSKSTPNP